MSKWDELDELWRDKVKVCKFLPPNFPTIVCLCGVELTERVAQRFWEKVDMTSLDGCWLWNASLSPKGYGQFRILSDECLFLNVGGYMGYSTRRELAHALAMGKVVRFLEPEKA